ncbi:NAD(P)/FAD-dependent oxidoreductase [Candidatus Izemoplasma sp. B36]|uniref:NAD(P)/FAD-dependent oxidoreductase n=1 Tax=Candidatus Izemoplasma sp. B36 TaxID=3242468 RepID=UPI0035567BE6
MRKEIIVVGGGASGLAAALAAKKEGRDVLLIEREDRLGGILNQCIHNGFGLQVFKEEYTGPEYADKYIQEFLQSDIPYYLDTTVTNVDKLDDGFEITFSSTKTGMKKIQADALIMSTGCYERTRGSIIMPGDRPYGVITAGSAQRYLNIDGYMVGKNVFILGSGDIGLIMARRMHLEGANVLGVAELMPYSNGLTRNIVQCLNDFDIPLFLSHTVTQVNANKNQRLESIIIQQVDKSFKPIEGTEKKFEVDTLLLSIGLIPDITLLDNLEVEKDNRTKSVKINQSYQTSVPGIFICGNSLQVHDLVDNVSLESERAGKCASKYVLSKKIERKTVNIIAGNNLLFVTPHYIDFASEAKNVVFQFRSKTKIAKSMLKISQKDNEIKSKRINYVVPAEMESISIPLEEFNDLDDVVLDLEVL